MIPKATYALLEATELARSKRISLANDRDDVDTRRQTAHELNIHLAQTMVISENMSIGYEERCAIRVTSRGDEVEKRVNAVVAEAGVTLDTRLLSENVIVLAFEIANNFLETA